MTNRLRLNILAVVFLVVYLGLDSYLGFILEYHCRAGTRWGTYRGPRKRSFLGFNVTVPPERADGETAEVSQSGGHLGAWVECRD